MAAKMRLLCRKLIVFLSYAHEAEERETPQERSVRAVANHLRARGHTVHLDAGLTPDEDFALELRAWVQESAELVFFVSPESLRADSFCLTELEWARGCKPPVPVLPILHTPKTALAGSPFATRHVALPSGAWVVGVCDGIERRSRLARRVIHGVIASVLVLTVVAYFILLYAFERATAGELTFVAKLGLAATMLPVGALAAFAIRWAYTRSTRGTAP